MVVLRNSCTDLYLLLGRRGRQKIAKNAFNYPSKMMRYFNKWI